jgi:hypothetical protein
VGARERDPSLPVRIALGTGRSGGDGNRGFVSGHAEIIA